MEACCIDRGPKGNIYRVHETPQTLEYVKWLNYPWHIYSDYNTLNTPSQMQRECNVVAFGELILSTRLKHKHENNTSKVRNQKMSSKRATLGTCRCRKGSPPQEGVAFTTVLQQIPQVFTNQYFNSSNMSLALENWTRQ